MNVRIESLIRKGVAIPNPSTVYLDERVDLDRISGTGTILYPGCKLFGKSTLISDNVTLGLEGPVTLDDCLLGPGVELKGGYFNKSVFLEKVSVGSGAQIREGTILEEAASVAHTVGLKQTILFPFVTLGSLINFCDCLLSGGTGPTHHSEVGSSFIHFNFTPNQDKATPSLFGDVPNGVMLNQAPVFLGGQGGVVGPCRLTFGTVTAAGTIVRKDENHPGRLIFGGVAKGGSVPFGGGGFQSIQRIIVNNVVYAANLAALMQWYRHIRSLFISESFPDELWKGLVGTLRMGLDERIKQLNRLWEKVSASIERFGNPERAVDASSLLLQQRAFVENWSGVKEILQNSLEMEGSRVLLDPFQNVIQEGIRRHGRRYLPVIQHLSPEEASLGTRWLQDFVERLTQDIANLLPTFRF